MAVTRFGVSLEKDLLDKLDTIVQDQRFPNRSRALRFLIQQYKSDMGIEENEKVTGAIVLVYDHNMRRLHSDIAALKHEYNCMVLSSQHIHIDTKNCIETIAVKGTANKVFKLGNKLMAVKGIKHGNITVSVID